VTVRNLTVINSDIRESTPNPSRSAKSAQYEKVTFATRRDACGRSKNKVPAKTFADRKNNQQFFDATRHPPHPPLSSYKVTSQCVSIAFLAFKMASNQPSLPTNHLFCVTVSADALKFGTFTLKSKRISLYFFNAGLFHRARLLRLISSAYPHTLASHAAANPSFQFDILFLRTKAFRSPWRLLINLRI